MEWNAPMTLATPGGTLTFNQATGDTYINDPGGCSGLDGVPLRVTLDDAPQTDGGLKHKTFRSARHILMTGTLLTGSGSSTFVARNTLEATMTVAIDSLLNADGTLAWTVQGGAPHSITVRTEMSAVYSGGLVKSYAFGLYAANPTIT